MAQAGSAILALGLPDRGPQSVHGPVDGKVIRNRITISLRMRIPTLDEQSQLLCDTLYH
jgi:hypothetical protein